MPKRVYNQRVGPAEIELVDYEADERYKIRIDREGVAAVSIDLTLAQLQEMSDSAWHAHEERGGQPLAPVDPRKAYGGSDPE